jgi:hypothetical protein
VKRAPQSTSFQPAPEDLQEELQAHLFLLFYRVKGGQIRYFQRSLVNAVKEKGALETELSGLVEEARESPSVQCREVSEDLDFRLLDPSADEKNGLKLPLDDTVTSISAPLRLGAKSPSDGRVHPPGAKFCPVSGSVLFPVITTEDFETS